MGEKILLIEDDIAIVNSVAYTLSSNNFAVLKAFNGKEALNLFTKKRPDLVILDIMLPELDGVEVCKRIRSVSSVPIIMLTARSEESDKVHGLDCGADDYITKPFGSRELLARVKSLLRRVAYSYKALDYDSSLNYGTISMDKATRTISVGQKSLHFPLKQFHLMEAFMSNPEKLITREELFKLCWDEESVYESSLLDVHMNFLREKLESLNSYPTVIKTIRGVGYRLEDGSVKDES